MGMVIMQYDCKLIETKKNMLKYFYLIKSAAKKVAKLKDKDKIILC